MADAVGTTKASGPSLKNVVRVYHSTGGGSTDFDNEKDALAFVSESTEVKSERQPDGSVEKVYSPNSHLFHGARHPDYPSVRVDKFQVVVWPEDEE